MIQQIIYFRNVHGNCLIKCLSSGEQYTPGGHLKVTVKMIIWIPYRVHVAPRDKDIFSYMLPIISS